MTAVNTALSRYAIDPHSGFVPAVAPITRLPDAFSTWDAVVPQISALLRSRRIREVLRDLPLLDVAPLVTNGEQERALLVLSVFANSWVWGGEEPHLCIPACIAQPLCSVARKLDRPPIVHYASMALNNWRLVNPARPLCADNARMQVQFLGGVDEDWFFMASLGVELTGAPLLPLVHAACEASLNADDSELAGLLEGLAARMPAVRDSLARVREWCDPHAYYLRVRPFLSGWPAPGVVYAGVTETPLRFVGGSAGQSALIQALDAVLGIDHANSTAGAYLRNIRRYMPVGHRAFVEDTERTSRVRGRALRGSVAVREAYNAVLDQIHQFRLMHVELAHDYIAKPSGVNPDELGTGGTSFTGFLRATSVATEKSKL